MDLKRALVVDDSKSARLALKVLLERYQLGVLFAETGEEAIDLLKTQIVDVIFMDHMMPGMTGLETVSVIKGNPRTAMIPVMMYTAKEGEVFVGQARALGAVGVLPKQVQPGVLFDMLLKLGLVKDRRSKPRKKRRVKPGTPVAVTVDEIDRQYDEQALGMSVKALVTRVLEEQHMVLRSDILSSHRGFAKQVAAEIYEKQRAERELTDFTPEPPKTYSVRAMLGLAAALLVPSLILLVMLSQTRDQRDQALAERAALIAAAEQELVAAQTESMGLITDIGAERRQSRSRYLASLAALEWAVNRDSQVPYDELALNEARLAKLEELLVHLTGLGFQGTVRIESHLGEFCLERDESGDYRLADPSLPVDECVLIGHPLDESAALGDRQSVGFANFLATSPLINGSGIEVQVLARSRADSIRKFPYASNLQMAGEWNRVAEMNNRVQYSLVPAAE